MTGPAPDAKAGLAGEAMIGTVPGGSKAGLVWVVNNQSTGGDPSDSGYTVVPPSTIARLDRARAAPTLSGVPTTRSRCMTPSLASR